MRMTRLLPLILILGLVAAGSASGGPFECPDAKITFTCEPSSKLEVGVTVKLGRCFKLFKGCLDFCHFDSIDDAVYAARNEANKSQNCSSCCTRSAADKLHDIRENIFIRIR